MISEIRISDIHKYNFVYKQKFWISDISNGTIDNKMQLMISLNDLISLFQFLIALNNFWYL